MSNFTKLNPKIFFAFLLMSLAAASPMSFAQTSAATTQNIKANRAVAQKLLADGMPNEALQRIEQVIIAAPRDLSARFFRSQILVSLGRGQEVRQEVELMASLELSANEQAKVNALLAPIQGQSDPFSGKLTAKLAMGYADNVNAWPKNGVTTVGGLELPLPDPLNQKFDPVSDRVTEGLISFSGKQVLNEQRDLKAKFGFSGKLKEAADTVNANQKYVAGNFGIEKQFTNGVMIEGGISKSDMNRVNQHKSRDVNSDISATKYHTGAAMWLPHQMRLSYQFEFAKNDHSNSASLLAFLVLPYQQRLIASATYRQSKYKRQYVNDNTRRRDKTWLLSLGYSIDGGELTPELDKIWFGLDITYTRSKSNQASAEIHPRTYMLSASRSFDL